MNALAQTPYENPLNTWQSRSDTYPDFHTWLARQTAHPAGGRARINDLDSMYSRSTGVRSSLAVHTLSERSPSARSATSAADTTASNAIPRLTHEHSMASSIGSADTSAASALNVRYMLESQDGVLTLPERFLPNANLLCPFQILDCEAVFADIRAFKTHVFSHFRGHPAPKAAICFLCDERFEQREGDRPALAWNDMLSHLAQDHFRQGQRLATVRTDFGLMRWMYSRKIINDAQFKRTQLYAVPTLLPNPAGQGSRELVNLPMAPMPPSAMPPRSIRPPMTSVGLQSEAFTVQASRRAERRRRDATRSVYNL